MRNSTGENLRMLRGHIRAPSSWIPFGEFVGKIESDVRCLREIHNPLDDFRIETDCVEYVPEQCACVWSLS